jgi:hypothetical protein
MNLSAFFPSSSRGGEFEVEVVEPEVAQQAEHEVQQVADLLGRVLLGDVGVGVVLGQGADAGEAVDDAGGLAAVDGAELEEAQRKVTVGASAGAVDEVVHRAVHRLEAVRGALLDDLAGLCVADLVDGHRGNMFSP